LSRSVEPIDELPGKKSAELQKLRDEYVTRALGIVCPAFIEKAEGSYLRDVDGNKFIDMASGIGVNVLGNLHEEIVVALQRQLERYMHLCFGVVHFEEYVRLAEKLAMITPGDFSKHSFLNNSGAEAVENSVKIARFFTKRPGIVSFVNSFHGRTMFSLALTGKDVPYKKGFEPFPKEVIHAEYAYCYRCPFGRERDSCSLECLYALRKIVSSPENKDVIGSLILETMQGEGGFIVPPADFIRGVRDLCNEHSIVLIDDEIQTGLGRTGKMFCAEHFDLEPDMILTGKALGGGLPLGAVTGRAEIMDSPPKGGLGTTFGGNPMSCAAALTVVDLVQKNLNRVPGMNERIADRLHDMQSRHTMIGDVRGLGLLMAIELVKDRKTKEPAKEETRKIVSSCAKKGLVILSAGLHGNVIRLHPSMLMDTETLDCALDIIDATLHGIEKS